ncbi:hypothetical protein BDY19DRAFT_991834 [Irpex rosettiformis]|uniref:Uncharacterized protein n=1 Tax=Irpex rosettiformis TaxID=378272 RepID=A0ACB8UAJ7_9APHY|nr:hypothetical protein BDY19DRAFT_991834 [Irpex rosettiformis]
MSSEEVGLTSSVLSLNSKQVPTAESSTVATLRSLYSRAAKAFLHRDFSLTYSLLTSAFSIITPPIYSPDDEIATFRRKWDILRITVETTVYSSPPPSDGEDVFPSALRANQLLSPQSLVTTLHARSLQLFTPSSPPQKPLSVFVPHQVLTTLILSSIKLESYDIGRGIIEDWLARRTQDSSKDGYLGYSKVIELYCLHVLPKLEEWEYAQDFLEYERELKDSTRENMKYTLRTMFQETVEARNSRFAKASSPDIEDPSPSSTRSVSPARSTSSESTTSTHTVTPQSPHPSSSKGKGKTKVLNGTLNGLTRLTPSPALSEESSAQSSTSVTTSRTVTPNSVSRNHSISRRNVNGNPRASSSQKSDTIAIRTTATAPLPRSVSSENTVREPSTLALIRSYINDFLRNTTKSKIIIYFVVFVVFPAISLAVRIRRRRNFRLVQAGEGGVGAADVVRRRLRGTTGGPLPGGSLLGSLWNEVIRAVGDTIRMGGGGLA